MTVQARRQESARSGSRRSSCSSTSSSSSRSRRSPAFVVGGPDLGGPRPRAARARRALVGVGRLRLADEHDRPRGRRRAARDVRRDGRDADRLARGAGCRSATTRCSSASRTSRAAAAPGALRDRGARRPRPAARRSPGSRVGHGDRPALLFVAAGLDGARPGRRLGARARDRHLRRRCVGERQGWRLSPGTSSSATA